MWLPFFPQGWKDENGQGKSIWNKVNLGVVTVNLPRIALESEGDGGQFLGNFKQSG